MTIAQRLLVPAALLAALAAPAAAQAPADRVTFIHAGTLLDRPGQAPRGASTIVVRNGRIESVRDGHAAPAEGAVLVDLKNAFVLPGLIDAHVHIFSDDDKLRA